MPPLGYLQRGVHPAERIGPKGRHAMHLADMPGQPTEAQRVGGQGLDLVACLGQQCGALTGGQSRAVAEENQHGHHLLCI